MSAKTAVIMQPTFLPWLGWFDLLDQADVFIILDDVGFSKQSWQQRNQIRVKTGLLYLTLPVRTSGRMGQLIRDAELANTLFVEKMIKTIQGSYSGAAYFDKYFSVFCNTLRQYASSRKLLDLNYGFIRWLLVELKQDKPIFFSSGLDVGGVRGEYVAALCNCVGATQYLSPKGAEEYLLEDKAMFDCLEIDVSIHGYKHPSYKQCFEPFIPYASVLDLLMNEGTKSMEIIRSGRETARVLGN